MSIKGKRRDIGLRRGEAWRRWSEHRVAADAQAPGLQAAFEAGWEAALKPPPARPDSVPLILMFETEDHARQFGDALREITPGLVETWVDG